MSKYTEDEDYKARIDAHNAKYRQTHREQLNAARRARYQRTKDNLAEIERRRIWEQHSRENLKQKEQKIKEENIILKNLLSQKLEAIKNEKK
ncbi:MAG: hypothetical protein E7485_08720 [Ruminococcaceae bacterium]|nr:hypothetical protein [Oscillospiraceae bacterium]